MNRSQKLEVRSQKLEVRRQKSEVCLLSSVLCPLVFCFLLLILISCTGMKIEREEVSEGTLVFYLYLPNSNQQDINFTIEKIEIKQRDGGWIKLSEKPFVIRSLDIAKDQVLLTESNIMEGEYDRVMIRISNASVRRNEKFHTLALPQPNGEVELKGDIISIGSSESRAIFLTWEPDKSVSNNYLFSPSITIESQRVSPKTLLLYVANSGSNYVSVVDRFENRVVGVIGVEKNPTSLVLSQEQERLYVLNSRSNSISIIDTSQDFVRDRIQFSSGIEPVEMAMIPYSDRRNHGKLYITNRGSNDVTAIDTFMKSQIKSVRVGNAPLGVSANPERQEVYVANSGSNSISVIDSITDEVKATINVDRTPVDVVVVRNNIYVLNAESDSITIIDTVTKTIKGRIQAGINPRKGIYSEKYNRIYLSNYGVGQVSFLIPSSAVITRSINAGSKPIGLAIDEGRNHLYITDYSSNRVILINPVSEVVEKIIIVGKKPYGIVSVK
ncbi:MAG: hypothetical protein A2W77_04780 [Nitrospinae bacterium RIFCSPLOWO2_12_39_16]|nr:MAG: hypothetical protein A2W77_04780 [Nitrospinae bacterium RIFCSPLOWO2_12_39_16]